MSKIDAAAIEYGTLWYYGADGERKSAGPNEMKIDAYLAGAKHVLEQARMKQQKESWRAYYVYLSDLEELFAEVKE